MSTTSAQRRATVVRAVVRTVAALAFLVLAVAALLEPSWVESTSGLEPDGGSGAFELLLVGAAGVVAAATSIGAVFAWRRVLASEA
jgi:hypothetical protein